MIPFSDFKFGQIIRKYSYFSSETSSKCNYNKIEVSKECQINHFTVKFEFFKGVSKKEE